MLDRRGFVRSGGLSLLALRVRHDVGIVWQEPKLELPDGIGTKDDYFGALPPGRLGTKKPLPPEERVAADVVAAAPKAGNPYDVARFFLDVGNGKFDPTWVPFVSGWPERWNPVIVESFNATDTVPKGDTTPWCAAFVNWCFLRATNNPATTNASSGSFRCFGASTAKPHPGDIVVFRRKDSTEECIGQGHVGFFVSQDKESVEVLGGNQIASQNQCHRISSKRIGKKGSVLEFHSFRTNGRPKSR